MRRSPAMLIGVLIVALLATACTGDDGGKEATATGPRTTTGEPEEQAAPLPPSDFEATAAAFQVALTWTPAPDGDVDRFTVYRNTTQLASLAGSATAYTDTSALPGKTYSYEIEARAGEAVTDRVLVTTETPLPPLRAARVTGSFDVHTRRVSATGYGEYPAPNFGWRFRPRCADGPCATVVSDLHVKRVHATLSRRGAKYRGSYNGRFTIECAGTPVSSSVTIELRVDAARVIDREWRASRLVGTLDQSEAEQLGCRYSEARFSVRARLVQ